MARPKSEFTNKMAAKPAAKIPAQYKGSMPKLLGRPAMAKPMKSARRGR
jgi:hypothetical protein